ncbi:dTDP-4-dehydrorhamnose 3,5-epimerase [Pseudomonas helleri]|jgi:dTDP-4-dehydrorhamnose 3,5-epimerase|uniref:dTDP-4-dehydrorhamnose 3,5-epimerase n=2 Tax=Pseudomonas helleri TaxID=1608996 RepID=A0A6A7ZJI7_9PSED|nr:dTDP-4-dehydrorhamnose 3,5-epimerase [Pseudomonas helleri]KMN18775.1 dTDP-4-dehydrorhamnose 3,5-epimerase [Pseudomonas helleri]MQT76995.1 dTDP-4-dehydrorhamnose 3,5-epimerase [Pseudomonas helleri]MQT97955.1 dTDP-4-dehydrorhamnose 3,5-epimerase [Pseudomonas helleri]MQU05116.1 dTDP-4-dehydrorhamnose 3,5-epimerase [Pseudomonas helleri]MQU33858.1 dTDP-4-dehydrorhamnose 3,5-epimerase [Pseudomonas helleri]
MKFTATALTGLVIVEPDVFQDDRGWFLESFNLQRFKSGLQELGLNSPDYFVQDNLSSSKKGVVRGLHYQLEPHAQGKLVSVLHGAVFDVAVDLRPNSISYGKWFALELSAANKKMLWIPEGFAHGFLSLEDDTCVSYKVDKYYNKDSERSVLWNDEVLSIQWPLMDSYFLSSKDSISPGLFVRPK